MESHLSIAQTADGSKTIFNSIVNENYHSKHGALQETKHVFLGKGLQYYLNKNASQSISVLEVGFGTGLNFLLSADFCSVNNIELNYTGIEAFPLPKEMIEQTDYQHYVSSDLWQNFTDHYLTSIKQLTTLTKNIHLEIIESILLDYQTAKKFDVVYFDAFAKIHQPEMWDYNSIQHTVNFLKPGGVFVTYAITGELKRMLVSLNMAIEKLPGALGKREMLRAYKN